MVTKTIAPQRASYDDDDKPKGSIIVNSSSSSTSMWSSSRQHTLPKRRASIARALCTSAPPARCVEAQVNTCGRNLHRPFLSQMRI
ncbi:hypothetical protein VFPFJ_02750 [Purpureocillium lilacinum]|uniref:Uncharacterized protein n=1 Tax=Purpureocillium lilacinum TaxID=33203 RepID=A0A179HVT1_PURLI|nr:hypothetical protein VFPFJ_02750 [Purpureocillium lilacinum]OAQ78668.1 hypothetical protein VFPBJ_06789 [Purpureocillium lilacinum]OAQ93588.1 hypothetical protein VFPFJ_02750 [Purpureocillium lilacinum]